MTATNLSIDFAKNHQQNNSIALYGPGFQNEDKSTKINEKPALPRHTQQLHSYKN